MQNTKTVRTATPAVTTEKSTTSVELDEELIGKLRAIITETRSDWTAEDFIEEEINNAIIQKGWVAELIFGISDNFKGKQLAERRELNNRIDAIANPGGAA